jgi:hypothetical protein
MVCIFVLGTWFRVLGAPTLKSPNNFQHEEGFTCD